MLAVIVGKEPRQERFLVHEGIFSARSEFFRRAMNGNWAERDERLIELPEDDPEVFSMYVNFVYTNNIATGPNENPVSVEWCDEEYMLLSELFVLCEKLCDIGGKNAVIRAILAVSHEVTDKHCCFNPFEAAITIMYSGTPKSSLGRKLMADMWTCKSVDYLSRHGDELPKDFLLDLAIARHNNCSHPHKNAAEHAGPDAYLEGIK
ncbi:hypothetical protein FB567DRAFT_600599 [Paraphoma chrysanthemicola]|uniref:BTB domain-containing protein n=1 Tax=Paraphoma chrysanthemicola TaxID=798071 RepID=A0A8K0W4J6_9PLEO|nr:hypothetical protein FB567DRAFT_600599 [Paraphoma chrysanthemicola]